MKKVLIMLLLLLVILFPLYGYSEIYDINPRGIITGENISSFSDEEFNAANIKIHVFTEPWCEYCRILKSQFSSLLYKNVSKKDVKIRIYDKQNSETLILLKQLQKDYNLPEQLLKLVPLTIIEYKEKHIFSTKNKVLVYLGYNDTLAQKMITDIKALIKNAPPVYGGNLKEYGFANPSNQNFTSNDWFKIAIIGLLSILVILFVIIELTLRRKLIQMQKKLDEIKNIKEDKT